MYIKSTKIIWSVLICLTCWYHAAPPGIAQMGMSSLSVGMSKAGIFPAPGEIQVAHFINYHEHLLPIPTGDQRLALDVKQLDFNQKHYLQIGLATPRQLESGDSLPLNLALVIDVSGSMTAGNRISRVQQGLSNLVEHLRPDDRVAIVTFSTTAQLLLPACQKTDQARIQAAIDKLRPTGSTNFHAGLMLGYYTALESFDPTRSNRVILLTDGIANVGEVNPTVIAQQSASFNQRGIDLSTIGVGKDFNHSLLRELADAGRGAVHFVDDQEDLTKCFVDEVESLLHPAARNLRLRISGFDRNSVPRVFGYSPDFKSEKFSLPLENMSCGSTQVVILEFPQRPTNPNFEIRIKFDDAVTGKQQLLNESINWNQSSGLSLTTGQPLFQTKSNSIVSTSTESSDWQIDRDNKKGDQTASMGDFPKNLAIAFVAQGLADSSELVGAGDLPKAQRKIKRAIKKAKQVWNVVEDSDFQRVLQITESLSAIKR